MNSIECYLRGPLEVCSLCLQPPSASPCFLNVPSGESNC